MEEIPPLSEVADDQKMCIECEDTHAVLYCASCQDNYCSLCFQAQHRKGTRKHHAFVTFENKQQQKKESYALLEKVQASENINISSSKEEEERSVHSIPCPVSLVNDEIAIIPVEVDLKHKMIKQSNMVALRLDEEERDLLNLMEAALRVSEYTDNVDILCYRTSSYRRIQKELEEVLQVLLGLVLANHFSRGRALVNDKSVHDNASFFQRVFEIGRRYVNNLHAYVLFLRHVIGTR